MKATLVLLPGDGIGPEIVGEAKKVLTRVASKFGHDFAYQEHLIGGIAIDQKDDPLPPETVAAAKASNAVLLGAVGGPKWDLGKKRPEQGLLAIRKALGLFANLRPVKPYTELLDFSPVKRDRLEGTDLLFIRELTGGLYFGEPKKREQRGDVLHVVDTLAYTDVEIRRIVKLAFKLAKARKGKVTSIDKANVLESSRVWREIAIEVGKENPDVKLEHQLVDSCAMRLVTHAREFDVCVTENMFGDILTDEAAILAGSLGVLPSASLGEGDVGLYEPIHGSAPDIAGKGIANPIGTILSAAMLLRHSLHLEAEAKAVEDAVAKAIAGGARTADFGGKLGTAQIGEAILSAL